MSNPAQPVSTTMDWPVGDTISVAWPPSTSMKYMSMVLAANTGAHNARNKAKKGIRMAEIVSHPELAGTFRHGVTYCLTDALL